MLKFQKLVLITVPALFIFAFTVQAQVVVEKSKDKVVISGIPYYIHIVKKGETVYSIARAYAITPQELTKENPSAENGVKADQSLRIPVVDNIPKPKTPAQTSPVLRDESKYIYHKLNPGETVFALSKKYGGQSTNLLKAIWRPLSASLLMACILMLLQGLNIFILVFIGGFIYFFSLALFGEFHQARYKPLRMKLSRITGRC
jgi:LysM repeat protein